MDEYRHYTIIGFRVYCLIMLIVGRRFLPWLLLQVAGTGSRELFTLTVIASAICIAFIAAKLFNVSFALGAFFAHGHAGIALQLLCSGRDLFAPAGCFFGIVFCIRLHVILIRVFLWMNPCKFSCGRYYYHR